MAAIATPVEVDTGSGKEKRAKTKAGPVLPETLRKTNGHAKPNKNPTRNPQ
jgi:hypothetical protein